MGFDYRITPIVDDFLPAKAIRSIPVKQKVENTYALMDSVMEIGKHHTGLHNKNLANRLRSADVVTLLNKELDAGKYVFDGIDKKVLGYSKDMPNRLIKGINEILPNGGTKGAKDLVAKLARAFKANGFKIYI